MDNHALQPSDPWYPNCCFICKREALVAAVLKQAQDCNVMVIRATPMVGKTTLLKLLGHHIAHQYPNLELVYLSWNQDEEKNEKERDDKYLDRERNHWRELNAEIRPYNSSS
jgi:chromosomal replication initiation ATPase DnaA